VTKGGNHPSQSAFESIQAGCRGSPEDNCRQKERVKHILPEATNSSGKHSDQRQKENKKIVVRKGQQMEVMRERK